jgi:hypothetical protein
VEREPDFKRLTAALKGWIAADDEIRAKPGDPEASKRYVDSRRALYEAEEEVFGKGEGDDGER